MRYLLSLSLVVLAFIANARQITPDEALAAAQDFFNNSSVEQSRAPRAVRARLLNTAQTEDNAPYYIFNASDNNGFVIISGDDRAKKILGYSDKGNFDVNNMPPQLSAMLDHYAESLSKLSGSTTDQSWTAPQRAASSEGGVLLETANWGQGYPYNSQCPVIDGVQCPTGCVATAMAIVMKYHNWPSQGRNKWECTRNSIFHSVDFSESKYEFSLLKNSYLSTEQDQQSILAIGKLMYDCGVAACMFYNKEESGTISEIIGHVLMRFFRYSPKCQHIYRKHFSDSDWSQIIIDNLAQNNPIIYFATSDSNGHAFVIDGAKSDMLHINWGWDGNMNGYYDLTNLNPYNYEFDKSHSMVVNITPDYESKDFAELWCNIGLFNWLNSEFESEEEQNGRGMEISCTNVVPGIPFNLITATLSGPNDFEGEVALCVSDKDNNLKEIIERQQVNQNLYPGESFPYGGPQSAAYWENVVYNGQVVDGDKLQLYAKRNDEEIWRLVTWTDQTPCTLPMTGNTPTVVTANINIHCEPDESNNIIFTLPPFRTGQATYAKLICKNGFAHLYFDGDYISTASDFTHGFGHHYRPKSLQMDVDIFYYPFKNLKSKTITVSSPGTLKDNLNPIDSLDLYNLKIIGEINSVDLESLYHLHTLGILDLSEVTLSQNVNSEVLPFVQILYLPKNSNNVNASSVILNIPETINSIGSLYDVSFIKFNSLTPPQVKSEIVNLTSTILLVPSESVEKYKNHNIWGNAMGIEAFDEPMKASWNMPYLNISDSFCVLCSGHDYQDAGTIPYPPDFNESYEYYPGRYFDIPSEVEFDNIIRSVMFAKDVNRIANTTDFQKFNGRDLFFMPSEGFIKGYSRNPYFPLYPMQYIITPRLSANFSGIEGRVLMPDHCSIGKGDEYDSQNNLFVKHTMFKLYKQKSSNLLSVVPNLEGITIEYVKVNGTIIEPSNNLYKVDFSNPVNVTVSYNVYGIKTLTTDYPSDLIDSLPETDLSMGGVDTIYYFSTGIIEVYNLQGIKVFQGNASEMPTLPSGIYLKQVGNTVTKFIIN